jgi:hypothetical protein
MKRSSTLALIAVAVAYLLGLQVIRYERGVAREKSTIATAIPGPAPANPPAHAASPGRRVEFGGYPCHEDKCSDDWAGYRWAQANRIADPDDCTGSTGAFIEGCRVYARQQTQGSRSG